MVVITPQEKVFERELPIAGSKGTAASKTGYFAVG
jgi:hypothetical protein